DTERYEAHYNNGSDPTDYNADNTVGDLDDILSFTAKAPDGKPFRGRYIKPIYDTQVDGSGNTVTYVVDGERSTFESQYAEIVWFVRGTTLYRRVLPILAKEMLNDSFVALQAAATNPDPRDPELKGVAYENIQMGFGFFYFYDVSVHLGLNGRLVANTLGDLTNRENRYFYWNPSCLHLHPENPNLAPIEPLATHGANDAWYWLRMATLQESAAPNFRAGAPYGQDSLARDGGTLPAGKARTLYGASANTVDLNPGDKPFWKGYNQDLTVKIDDPLPNLPANEYAAGTLPRPKSPFIDFWRAPNVWEEVNYETGDLKSTADDFAQNSKQLPTGPDKAFNQDVMLTNVLSFNVKVWDPTWNAYIDLGAGVHSDGQVHFPNATSPNIYNPNELSSFGFYGDPSLVNVRVFDNRYDDHGNVSETLYSGRKYSWLPCVYDTWTEQYQRDLFVFDDNREEMNASGALADVNSDGEISAAQLQDYPPPYSTPIKSLQIEIRVFDPRSKTIRNNTFNVDLSRLMPANSANVNFN
ncbi:MAG: hypothetical protein IKS14_03600, partial [Thermoguttaceae bacterium]|nr:hypothetical protein [Thermoguttaceae bacterium]